MVNKLPSELEGPIEIVYYQICEYVSDFFHNNGITPNMITTIGNLFRMLVVWLIYKRKFYLAAVLFMIAYFFDCLDGYVARKYKMTSKFGSYYDCVSDNVFNVLTIGTILLFNPFRPFLIILLFGLPWLLFARYYSLQNSYYDKDAESNAINTKLLYSIFPKVSKKRAAELLKYYRFFSCGTFILFFAIFIALQK